MGKNQHVVKHPDGWAVKGEGNNKATKVTGNQQEAIDIATNKKLPKVTEYGNRIK